MLQSLLGSFSTAKSIGFFQCCKVYMEVDSVRAAKSMEAHSVLESLPHFLLPRNRQRSSVGYRFTIYRLVASWVYVYECTYPQLSHACTCTHACVYIFTCMYMSTYYRSHMYMRYNVMPLTWLHSYINRLYTQFHSHDSSRTISTLSLPHVFSQPTSYRLSCVHHFYWNGLVVREGNVYSTVQWKDEFSSPVYWYTA